MYKAEYLSIFNHFLSDIQQFEFEQITEYLVYCISTKYRHIQDIMRPSINQTKCDKKKSFTMFSNRRISVFTCSFDANIACIAIEMLKENEKYNSLDDEKRVQKKVDEQIPSLHIHIIASERSGFRFYTHKLIRQVNRPLCTDEHIFSTHTGVCVYL